MSVRPQVSAETSARSRGPLEIRLLGPMEVRRSGTVLRLGGARPRALLALLCLRRGAVVSVDVIVDQLWGESPPPTARHMVAVYVSKLRKILGDAVLLTRSPGYVLTLDPEQLDIARFERLLVDGREALAGGDADSASARFGEALSLWRAAALSDFLYEPFAQAEIPRLEELRLLAEEERIESELALGKSHEIVGELNELVVRAPLRERLRGQLMLALYRSGRQADALAAYRAARETLVGELGVEPGPELRDLEVAILAQEERLFVAEPSPGDSSTSPFESRRSVTVVLADLVDLDESLVDPEAIRAFNRPRFGRVHDTAARYGGTAHELADGSAMIVFGSPIAHEDDCVRALRAADELRGLGVVARAGVETGEILTAPEAPASGSVVRAAAHLKEGAKAGEIVLGELTGRLVGEVARLEPLPLRKVQGLRLVDIPRDASSRPLRLDAPLVGRDSQLAQLRDLFERIGEERQPRLVTVVGEPGIGKSRLARELGQAVAHRGQVLIGRCPAFGEGMTYWPLREIVRQAVGAESHDGLLAQLGADPAGEKVADRIASALGDTEGDYSLEEIRWAAGRLFEQLARNRSVLVVIEDAHWAEPTFIDLIEHVAISGRESPILFLCLARPEFLDAYPNLSADALVVERLSEEASHELLSFLASGLADGAAVRNQLVETASGNPLFLEQLVAFTTETRGTEPEGIAPPTLRSLLSARLDRLGPGERSVVERASVVGPEFWAGAVAELLPPEGRPTLERHLNALARKGLIEIEASPAPFERAFRFRHVLIQEAAYRALPKARRAELHLRLGDWIEGASADVSGERDEIIGYHLEASFRYRTELGIADDETRDVARRAGVHLAQAGCRVSARGDLPATVKLLGRARDLLQIDAGDRLELTSEFGRALRWSGKLAEAEGVFRDAIDEAGRLGLEGLALWAEMELAELRMQTEPAWSLDEALEIAERSLRVFEDTNDERGLTRAFELVNDVYWARGQLTLARQAAERALTHAKRAGDVRLESHQRAALIGPSFFGFSPVDECVRLFEGHLEWAERMGVGSAEGLLLHRLGRLRFEVGRDDEALALNSRGLDTLNERGELVLAASANGFVSLGWLATNPDSVEHIVRGAYEYLRSVGEKGFLATVAANLAHILVDKGELDEAELLTRESEELSGGQSEDVVTEIGWRTARARLLARRGDYEAAEALAQEAVARTAGIEYMEPIADCYLTLGEVLCRAGRAAEGAEAIEKALRLYQNKGFARTAQAVQARLLKAERLAN